MTLRLRKGILLIDPGHDFVILRIFYGEASPFLDSDISPAEVVVAVADTGLADRRRGGGLLSPREGVAAGVRQGEVVTVILKMKII